MSKNELNSTWFFGETVGTWLSRRLQEVFNELPNEQKISQKTGNLISQKEWLSNKSRVVISTVNSLEKSEERHIKREHVRDQLAKVLGYYGYHKYILNNESEEYNKNIWNNITRDFRNLINKLPKSDSNCPFCLADTNYFLGIEGQTKRGRKKPVKTIYITTYNFKQFGAAQGTRDQGCFELEIVICEDCLKTHEAVFTTPVSKTIKSLSVKFKELNMSYKMVADIIGADESTISRIATGKTSKLQPDLLKKIIGLWSIGNLKPNILPQNYLYKEYMVKAVEYVLGEARLDELLPCNYDLLDIIQQDDCMPEHDEGFYVESFDYELIEFSFDADGIYAHIKAEYMFERRIAHMIDAQSASQELRITLITPEEEVFKIEVIKSATSAPDRVC